MKCLVLGLKSYRFPQKETGEIIQGAYVYYVTQKLEDNGSSGYLPIKMPIKYDQKEMFKEVPGVYEIDFALNPDSQGKAMLRFKGAFYVGDIDFDIESWLQN
ncbi:MAG: hypothetical protein C4589_10110 [Peptococcaceae bacterium]|nr:MAG: hypothetical protein C4589_10110 [Peptococcaceae bacterium]